MEGGSVGSVSSLHSISSARSTPIPATFKPLTPSASLLALANRGEDELRKKSPDQLLNIIHRFDNEYRTLISEHSNIVKDVNKKVQILLIETKGLKDINQSLQDDNQELRDLCCFLDDDRQRGRKLAREWQRFGRYTASVMRSEVSVYQEKLKELEEKQQELITDNVELKELCLYLDQERLRSSNQMRDEGDGSSSSTLAGNDDHPLNDGIDLVPVSQLHSTDNAVGNNTDSNEYIHQLEEKIRQLERNKGNTVEASGGRRLGPDGIQSPETVNKGNSLNKPEAVVHAMKVLEVHENLERPAIAVGEDNLDDKEKAIVREMCNVVWRKLGNVSAEQSAADSESSTPHPVYENIQPPTGINSSPEGGRDSSHSRDIYPGPAMSQQGPAMSVSGGRLSSVHKSADSIRHTEHQPQQQTYGQTDSYRARSASPGPPPYDKRSPPAYPGRSVSQSFNPSAPQYSGSTGNTGPHSQDNQPSKYGYVHMTRSTPVTPTPSQLTEPVAFSPPSASSTPSSKSHGVRSRSPGPKPVTQRPDISRSHSPGPYRGMQASGQMSDSHVYQNQPTPGSKRDNSYENIPSGPIFTSTPSSMGPNTSQYKMNNTMNQSADFTGQGHQSHGNYAYNGPPRDVPPSPAQFRNNNQSVKDHPQVRSSQAYYEHGSHHPSQYQKLQGHGQIAKSNATSSQQQSASYNSQQRPLPPYPSQQTSSSISYNKNSNAPNYSGDRRTNQPSSAKHGSQQYMYRQEPGNQTYPNRHSEGMKYNSRPDQQNQQYMNRPEPGNQQYPNRQDHGNQQQNYRQDYVNQMPSNRSGNQQGNPRQSTGNQMYSHEHGSRDQYYRN